MTTTRTAFPYDVQVIEHIAIPLRVGRTLSARVWLPRTDDPVPAVLEHLPYRKDDWTLWRDQVQLGYLAGHGYACIRTDIQGTGDSEGVLEGEYLAQELADGAEVIAWIADQDWCDGNVGMWGISWGGFNSLQVAALQPPALKAVISVASTVDRYAADVHYNGGCVLGSDMLPWATSFLCRGAMPPTPRIVGDDWKSLWLQRLAATPPFIDDWLSHQTRDEFWRHGSIGEDFSAITVPTLMVAGLADGYSNAPFDAVAGMPDHAWGLVGPWAHNYPEFGAPGPNIGFLQHALKWWDRWLKATDNGIENEPRMRIWMQEAIEPNDFYENRSGRWVAEPTWPPPNGHIVESIRYLTDRRLTSISTTGQVSVSTSQLHGQAAGEWWGAGESGTLPADQRIEDELSVTFTADPASEIEELCGFPHIDLRLQVDQADALLAVRLCDVAPDGSSLLVSRGQLNLTHRTSHEQPEPLIPEETFDVTIRLDAAAHSLPVGHRWRLALATTYWPLAWPSPRPATADIQLGDASRLRLPIRPPRLDDAGLPEFGPPEYAPADTVILREPVSERTITTDQGVTVLRHVSDGGQHSVDAHGTVIDSEVVDEYSIVEGEPLTAQVRCNRTCEVSWGDEHTRVRADATMRGDETTWHVESRLQAWHGDDIVFEKEWNLAIPRVRV